MNEKWDDKTAEIGYVAHKKLDVQSRRRWVNNSNFKTVFKKSRNCGNVPTVSQGGTVDLRWESWREGGFERDEGEIWKVITTLTDYI